MNMTKNNLYFELAHLLEKGNQSAIATIIGGEGSTPRKPGAKMLILADGTTRGTIGGGILESQVIQAARGVIAARRLQVLNIDLTRINDPDTDMRCGGKVTVLVEPVIPPDPVVIFGGGHVGQAIFQALSRLNFRITIVDDRPVYADPTRFPEAESVLCVGFDDAFQRIEFTPETCIIICTRAHKNDEECLRLALRTPARYVGMLGSRSKLGTFREKLMADGFTVARLDELRSPIGLAIGAVTPEEIAISVAAELIQIRASRISANAER
ncbi:MAG TPA: XdhC/CoxI family protein [Candidatus Sumerlaeota bacterium]|nr:XdhC/CoxI family protein [Candidatus Sumerlaeota bacterium]